MPPAARPPPARLLEPGCLLRNGSHSSRSTSAERFQKARWVLWRLRGAPSYERYVNRRERADLDASSPPLGRHEATYAALIPISKAPTWWELPQDERREILEEQSHHIATGLNYLPAVARRLYHGRDLGEPFDFLTWFEFEPADAAAFEELVATLRKTHEWTYVSREVDIRLVRDQG